MVENAVPDQGRILGRFEPLGRDTFALQLLYRPSAGSMLTVFNGFNPDLHRRLSAYYPPLQISHNLKRDIFCIVIT